jgi:hypothetical protein
MAICNIFETPARTRDQLEQIEAHLRTTGPIPPEGCRLVLIGPEHAITVWETDGDRDNFVNNRLRPAYQALDMSLDGVERKQFQVETLVAGDLVGAAG